MQKWKNKYYLYTEASHYHNIVRDILLNGKFKNIKAYQEVPLKDLVNESTNDLRIDWYIPSLNLIIECQGEQHFKEVNFGTKDPIDLTYNFLSIKSRDFYKKNLLIENGFLFLEIPYFELKKLTESKLIKMIEELDNDNIKS